MADLPKRKEEMKTKGDNRFLLRVKGISGKDDFPVNQQNSTPVLNSVALAGKMIYMKDRVSDSNTTAFSDKNIDLTEQSSERGDAAATRMARHKESDDANESRSIGNVSLPEGDGAAENKIATSLDDE
jgi:hypothetical protein